MRIFSLILAILAVYVFGYEDEYSRIASEQSAKYNKQVICNEIMDYYETGNIEPIEARMSKNLRDQYDDIGTEIKSILDALPGEIEAWEIRPIGYSSSARDGHGGVLHEYETTIIITTTEGEYYLGFLYAAVSTVEPEEAGFRSFSLLWRKPVENPNDPDAHEWVNLGRMSETESIDYTIENPLTVDELNVIYIEHIKKCLGVIKPMAIFE